MPKNEHLDKAQSSRTELQDLLSQVTSALPGVSEELKKQAEGLISTVTETIDKVSGIEVAGTKVSDLISVAKTAAKGGDVTGAIVDATVGSAIDDFLARYANYSGELVNVPHKSVAIGPFFGCLNVDIGFSANLTAALRSRRDGASITANASIDGSARISIGLSVGFSVPVLGRLSIGGGIQGGPDLEGRASMTLAASGTNLTCSMPAATLDINMSAELYLSVPDVVPEEVLEWVCDQIGKIRADGHRILYPLGSINIVTARTPSYSFTFEMARGRFSGGRASGEWSFEINQKVKDFVKNFKDTMVRAATELPERILRGIGDAVEGAVDWVGDRASDAADAVGDAADAVGDFANDYLNPFNW